MTATADWDAWGNLRASSGGQGRFGWAGAPRDATTGLTSLGARAYDPASGRFTSRDRLESSGPGTQGYNAYAYALNNPVTRVDPSGQASILAQVAVTIAAGSIVSFAFGAQAAGMLGAVAAVTVPPVMAFMLLALIFLVVLTVVDIAAPCAQATRHLSASTCDGTYEGMSLATLVGGMWQVATDVGTNPQLQKDIQDYLNNHSRPPKWPIVGVIAAVIVGAIVDARGGPDPSAQPSTDPNTQPANISTPPPTPSPSPTPTPHCDQINQSGGVIIDVKDDDDNNGTKHILDDHTWGTPDDKAGWFYPEYSNVKAIHLMFAEALVMRKTPWVWNGTRGKCIVRVDLADFYPNGVGLTQTPRTPTTGVELRVNESKAHDYYSLNTMFPQFGNLMP